jgi:leucyl aminopeptidase
VDIATLTGAAKVALGTRTAALFATDDRLATALARAGEQAGEPLWRMPLDHDYDGALQSDVADALQSPGNPGAVTAALFLEPFAGRVPWAHLDVAGPARADKHDGVISRGATGFGATLLAGWLESLTVAGDDRS